MNINKEIIIVSPHLGNGGAERVLSELIDFWTKVGCKVTIILTQANRFKNDYSINYNAELINISYNGFFRRIVQTYRLIKILSKRKCSVVISFINSAILLCGLASFFVKNKFIFSERCDPTKTPDTPIQRFVRNIMFTRAYRCVFQTEMAKSYFANRVRSKGVIIKNPLNQNLPPLYTGVRKKVIVSFGRLSAQKNLSMLIIAFKEFYKNHKDYSLEIYGRGPDEQQLFDLVKKLNLSKSVCFKGFCQNIYDKIYNSCMYISTSNFEGISNSMLEALGMGLPTICTDCPVGGAKETIENNINGILIPVKDVEALIRSMNKIADDPEFSDFISHRAYSIRKELDIEKIGREWLCLINN